MQIVEQTHEEKVKMYMKLDKVELIAMLLENQRLIEQALLVQPWPTTPSYPKHPWDHLPYPGYKITYTDGLGTIINGPGAENIDVL